MTQRIAVVLFVLSMATANLLVAWLGPWITPVNAFVLVGLSMVTRDVLHDRWAQEGKLVQKMLVMIAVSGLLAWAVNPAAGRIAVASALALIASAATETAAFSALHRHPWLVRANGSNVPGAITDTVVFVLVAFGPGVESLAVMTAQATTKLAGGALWSLLVEVGRRRGARARYQG